MSYDVEESAITLTRGDSLECDIAVRWEDGTEYEVQAGDYIRFRCTKKWGAEQALIEKDVTSLVLALNPDDTDFMAFGEYPFDVQLTTAAGKVDTFIKGHLFLTEETDPKEAS